MRFTYDLDPPAPPFPGWLPITVDLATGAVTVTSEAPLDRAAVAAAVEEAGYELVS